MVADLSKLAISAIGEWPVGAAKIVRLFGDARELTVARYTKLVDGIDLFVNDKFKLFACR